MEGNAFESVLAHLRAERDELNQTIAALEKRAAVHTAVDRGPGNGSDVASDSFFGMSIGDAAYKYLQMVKQPKPTAEIGQALERGGFTHTSKDFNTTVRTTLLGRREFIRVKGDWGLVEWYPGLKKDRKAKPASDVTAKLQDADRKAEPATSSAAKGRLGSGNVGPVLDFLARNPERSFVAKEVAEGIGANPGSVASLLSQLCKTRRVAKGEPTGYRAAAVAADAGSEAPHPSVH